MNSRLGILEFLIKIHYKNSFFTSHFIAFADILAILNKGLLYENNGL